MKEAVRNNFMVYSLYQNSITLSPNCSELGIYDIAIKVQSKVQTDVASQFSFKLTVIALTEEIKLALQNQQQLDNAKGSLTAKITQVSMDAIITVKFSQVMLSPQGNDTIQNLNQSMALALVSKTYGTAKTNYTILNFKGQYLQLRIQYPFGIDQLSLRSYDIIKLKFTKQNYFLSEDLVSKLPLNYELISKLPPQINTFDKSLLESIVIAVKYTLSSLVSSSLFLNLLLSSGLQQIWGLIENFQLISHLPLMTLTFPAIVQLFFSLINDIASMNLISSDSLNQAIFGAGSSNSTDQDDQYFSDSFYNMNYTSLNLIENLGLLFYMFILFTVWFFFSQIIGVMNTKSSCIKKLAGFFDFAAYYRFILESLLEFSICSLITLYNPANQSLFDNSSFIFSILLNFVMVLVIVASFFGYQSANHHWRQPNLKILASLVLHHLNKKQPWLLLYILALAIRKQAYAVIMTSLGDSSSLQLILLLQQSFIMLVLQIFIKPYTEKHTHNHVLWNETAYFAFIYTFVPYFIYFELDYEVREKIGTFQIILCLLILLANMIVMLRSTISAFIRKARTQQKIRKKAAISQAKIIDLKTNRANLPVKKLDILDNSVNLEDSFASISLQESFQVQTNSSLSKSIRVKRIAKTKHVHQNSSQDSFEQFCYSDRDLQNKNTPHLNQQSTVSAIDVLKLTPVKEFTSETHHSLEDDNIQYKSNKNIFTRDNSIVSNPTKRKKHKQEFKIKKRVNHLKKSNNSSPFYKLKLASASVEIEQLDREQRHFQYLKQQSQIIQEKIEEEKAQQQITIGMISQKQRTKDL